MGRPPLVDQDVLGEAATEVTQQCGNAVPRAKGGNRGAARYHLAGEVEAGDERHPAPGHRRQIPAAQTEVGAVDAAGGHRDEQLAPAWGTRPRTLLDAHHAWVAELREAPDSHR